MVLSERPPLPYGNELLRHLQQVAAILYPVSAIDCLFSLLVPRSGHQRRGSKGAVSSVVVPERAASLVMLLLEESSHFTLTHSSAATCLYATWSGHHGEELTRGNYKLILQHARATRSTKLLNDGLLDQNGWRELAGWIAQDCFQQLVEQGLLAVAWVLPRDPQALCDTRKLLTAIKQPLVETFDDAEAAYNWLHQWPR